MAIAIYQVDIEALRELLQPTTPLPDIDWHAVSQAMLEAQLRLTTNPLTSGEGISYRTEVYVPRGLVERKRQTRRREDVSLEQGSFALFRLLQYTFAKNDLETLYFVD